MLPGARLLFGGKAGGEGWRFFRLTVSAHRSSWEPFMQLSRLDFVTPGGAAFRYPSGVTYQTNASNNAGEDPLKLLDGSVDTKWCGRASSPYAVFDLKAPCLDTDVYSRWRWYTGNDATNRDPTAFSLHVSADGVTWLLADSVTGFSATMTRKALAYEGVVAVQQLGGGYKRKCVRRSYRQSLRPSARFCAQSWKEAA